MRTYASSRVKRKSFYRKSELQMFCWFPAAILVDQNGTPIWRLHTKLYKGAWNVSAHNFNLQFKYSPGFNSLPGCYCNFEPSDCFLFTWTEGSEYNTETPIMFSRGPPRNNIFKWRRWPKGRKNKNSKIRRASNKTLKNYLDRKLTP